MRIAQCEEMILTRWPQAQAQRERLLQFRVDLKTQPGERRIWRRRSTCSLHMGGDAVLTVTK